MIDLQNFSIDWPSVQHWLILFGIALGTLLLFIFLSRKSKIFLEKRLTRKMDDDLLANFLAGIFASLVVIVGIMIILRIIGHTGIVSGMLAGAGISAFIIEFALQNRRYCRCQRHPKSGAYAEPSGYTDQNRRWKRRIYPKWDDPQKPVG